MSLVCRRRMIAHRVNQRIEWKLRSIWYSRALRHEQARILEEACGDDADLRARVRRLLAAHERAGEVFDEVICLRSKRVARHSSEQPGEADREITSCLSGLGRAASASYGWRTQEISIAAALSQ
jgi:hypothetical protein